MKTRGRALSRFKSLSLFALLALGLSLIVTAAAFVSIPLALFTLGICLAAIAVQEVYF